MRSMLVLLAFFATSAFAAEYRLLDLDKFSFETWRIADNRDPYLPYNKPGTGGEEWYGGAAVNFDMTMAAYNEWSWYWENKAHMDGTRAQVRHVGWEWETGVSVNRKVDLYWYHHSRHIMEEKPEDKFPLTNRYGLRVVFWERGD